MKTLPIALSLILCVATRAAGAGLEPVNVVSPLIFIGYGNTADLGPFVPGVSNTVRYQEVHAASDFTRLTATPGFITGMEFRPDDSQKFVSQTVRDVQINLSTTLRSPDGLSLVFAENIGSDDTVVVGRGPLNLPSALPNQGFVIEIPFTQPFFYDPSVGNLLLDVRTYSGLEPPFVPPFFLPDFMDAERTLGDTVSIVAAPNVNASVAAGMDTRGLVIRFTFVPVPEPSTGLLCCVGVSVLLLWSSRRWPNSAHRK